MRVIYCVLLLTKTGCCVVYLLTIFMKFVRLRFGYVNSGVLNQQWTKKTVIIRVHKCGVMCTQVVNVQTSIEVLGFGHRSLMDRLIIVEWQCQTWNTLLNHSYDLFRHRLIKRSIIVKDRLKVTDLDKFFFFLLVKKRNASCERFRFFNSVVNNKSEALKSFSH